MSKVSFATISAMVLVAVCSAQAGAEDISAKQIKIKDHADPAKRQIQVQSKDLAVELTDADDPSANGASIQVYSATDNQCIVLPAGPEWTTNGKFWKYKNKLTKRQAQIGAKKLVVKIKSDVTYSLADDGSQGTVNVQVQFGDLGTRFCMQCPGNKKDDVKMFFGKDCLATPCNTEPTSCDPNTTTTTTSTTTTTLPPGFHGVLPPTSGRFNYNATLGVPGANSRCNTLFPGAHACTITELLAAEANGDLVGVTDVNSNTVTSFWAIDPARPDEDQCTVTIAWDYNTAHTGQFADRVALNNGTGDLGTITTGNVCSTQSWVGCCI